MKISSPGALRPFVLGLALVAVFTVATDARAITGWPSDCLGMGDEKRTFNPGDAVCVTGELDVIPPDEYVCAAGWTSVVPLGSANPIADVSRGGANYVLGCAGAGAFFDESLWLPPLLPGQYEITIDQYPFYPDNGVWGAEDYRVPQSITVTNAPVVFSVNVAAIKAAAEDGLRFAESIQTLADLLTLIDVLSTAADWIEPFKLWGGGAALVLGYVCYRADVICPTSYNSAVIGIGTKIMSGISKAQARHYSSIILDPPDDQYDVVVGLDMTDAVELGWPWTPGAAQELPERQIAIAQLVAIHAAATQALVPSLEKLQGAQIDGSNAGMMVQAEKVRDYAQLAATASEAIVEQVDALEARLTADGILDATVDVAGAVQELRANGLDEEGRALLRSFGYEDGDVDAALAEVVAMDVPAEVGWAPLLEATRGMAESTHDALVDVAAQAEAVRAENEPYALRLAPRPTISGPAQGSVGQALTLSATAEHWDPEATVTLSWDADRVGAYDDGQGASLSFTPPAPGRTIVAVKATDPDGRSDVAMHVLEVDATNAPPEIVGVEPAEPAPFADVGEVVVLRVDAVDADGDPLTFAAEGAEDAGDGTFAFTMPDGEPHPIRVTVSDDDPYSPDAVATWIVRGSQWEGGTGEGDGDADSDGDADTDADGDDDGGGRSSGGCGCGVAGGGYGGLAILPLALGVVSRRRSHR